MTLTQQHHHIIITSYTNNDTHSTTSSQNPHFIHKHTTQTHDTQSTTSSFNPNIIYKHMTLTQKHQYVILTSQTQTLDIHSTTSSSLTLFHRHDIHSTTSSLHFHFIHKDKTLNQQHHHINLTSYTNTGHSLNNIITSSSLHTQRQDTQSTTASTHLHFIHKHKILTQQLHHIILTSYTNT